jgi:hypothetical protein
MTTTTVAPQGLTPESGQELWKMQTDATVYMEIEGKTRYGDSIGKEFKVGPNRKGYEFIIKTADRLDTQRMIVDPALDPFRNGTFTRVDLDQQADPNTASVQAISTEQIVDLLDLPLDKFEAALRQYEEVPIRRIHETAVAMDVSHQKITVLDEVIKERYAKGAAQPSLTGDGETLS